MTKKVKRFHEFWLRFKRAKLISQEEPDHRNNRNSIKILKKLTRHGRKEILKRSILLKTISFKSATKFVLQICH